MKYDELLLLLSLLLLLLLLLILLLLLLYLLLISSLVLLLFDNQGRVKNGGCDGDRAGDSDGSIGEGHGVESSMDVGDEEDDG